MSVTWNDGLHDMDNYWGDGIDWEPDPWLPVMALFTTEEHERIRQVAALLDRHLTDLREISTTSAQDDVREWAGTLHDGMRRAVSLLHAIDAATREIMPNAELHQALGGVESVGTGEP